MSKPRQKKITVPEAMIYAMLTASAVDRVIKDSELAVIGSVVKHLPIFAGFDIERIGATTAACAEILRGPSGFKTVLDMIERHVPEHLIETTFALAVEVVAADDVVHLEEVRFLDLLAEKFDLDELFIAAVKRSAEARYRLA